MIMINEQMVDSLRESIRPYLKPKRYNHTLGVEREVISLAELFLPEKKLELQCAALLHDITKKLSVDEQISLCNELNIEVNDNDIFSPKLFHAKTASALIYKDFKEYAFEDVVSGVRWHTTGHNGMTVFESLVYLADYIEDTRTFDDCVKLRKLFYSTIIESNDKLNVLYNIMVISFDMTMKNLIDEGCPIDRDTVEARNYFLRMINEVIEK